MGRRKINYRHIIYALFDLAMTFVLVYFSFLTFLFRSNTLTPEKTNAMFIYCASISVITVLAFFVLSIYRIVTIYFTIRDAIKVAEVTVVIHILGLVALFVLDKHGILERPSIAAWALSTLSCVSVLVGLRVGVRVLNVLLHFKRRERIRTIVIGAGTLGKLALEDTKVNPRNRHKIVLFLDDNPEKYGGIHASIKIVGPIDRVAYFVEKYNAEEVILAITELPRDRLDNILKILQGLNVRISRMPDLGDRIGPNDVKMTRIDIDALLERKSVVLDNTPVKDMLKDQTVLVTGAGGSIGSELCRQILNCHPAHLILFDIYENSTYEIQQELSWQIKKEELNVKLSALIGSTYDAKRIENIFKTYHIDYVYHAAAYKHVPLMEDSPMEAIRTNIVGTYNVARFADKYKAKKMLLVSTDKAVRPTNVMGASKRFAELIIQYYSTNSKDTRYCAVRFGNVLGSNGSVVPLFEKQIKAKGPLTVTDRDIIRYFMTIPEAVSLILHSSMLANNGELFVLDMGTPVSILTLAEHMIRQAGYIPYTDIDIVFTGLRPGEKLYEETLIDLNHQEKTSNGRIFIEKKNLTLDVPKEITHVSEAFELDNNNEIKKLLAKIIPSYTPDLKHHD